MASILSIGSTVFAPKLHPQWMYEKVVNFLILQIVGPSSTIMHPNCTGKKDYNIQRKVTCSAIGGIFTEICIIKRSPPNHPQSNPFIQPDFVYPRLVKKKRICSEHLSGQSVSILAALKIYRKIIMLSISQFNPH